MDSVAVSFDVPSAGLSVPGHLLYVSSSQVNVLVPWELSGQVSAQVTVKVGNASSSAVAMAMSTYAPSMFQYPYNSGRAAATSTANRSDPIVTPTNPVPRGTALTLYLTGMGPVNNRPRAERRRMLQAIYFQRRPHSRA